MSKLIRHSRQARRRKYLPASRGRRVARCRVGGARFVAPVDTEYERELLLEHLDVHVGRQGAVRVRLGDRDWTVRLRTEDDANACDACMVMAIGRSIYLTEGLVFCRRCAHRSFRRMM